MLRKTLPLLYGCWLFHMMMVNDVFTLGLNTLTFGVLLTNGMAIGALYIIGYDLDI